MQGQSFGRFGQLKSGYGYFLDGDRCHDGQWISVPSGIPLFVGDTLGIFIQFDNLATVLFHVNGIEVGGFKSVSPPIYPLVAMMSYGDCVRVHSKMIPQQQ
jgi:hypothetical protein